MKYWSNIGNIWESARLSKIPAKEHRSHHQFYLYRVENARACPRHPLKDIHGIITEIKSKAAKNQVSGFRDADLE